jgi:hypothetical protein
MQAAIDNRRLATVMTDAAGETVSDGQWRPDFGWGKGALAPTGEPTQRGESLVTASPNHDEKWGEFRSMSPSPRLITDNIFKTSDTPSATVETHPQTVFRTKGGNPTCPGGHKTGSVAG